MEDRQTHSSSEEALGAVSVLMSHELTWVPEEENFAGGWATLAYTFTARCTSCAVNSYSGY